MTGSKKIALIGTLDTKGDELAFMKRLVEEKGYKPIVLDIGILGDGPFKPDIKREDLLKEIGFELKQLISSKGREAEASEIMSNALSAKMGKLYEERIIGGVIAIGGGMGSQTSAKALQQLPIGFPKILVSTKAVQAGIQGYAGAKDVVIIPSVCDIAGLNSITKRILAEAVGAVIGMIEMGPIEDEQKPTVVMEMNGAVTKCGANVKNMLENEGFEIIVFHGIGSGGRAMEEFIKDNDVICSIELGLNEIGNELFGGIASAGKERLEAAGRKGIPQIVTTGSVDFINFLGPETVPERYRHRKIVVHNAQSTVMRIEGEEMEILGRVIADKLNKSKGVTEVLIPLRGFSMGDQEGREFYDPESDNIFINTLERTLSSNIKVFELDLHINDKEFAEFIFGRFLKVSA